MLLTHFNPNRKTIIASSASNYGLIVFIPHIFPNLSEEAISRASRTSNRKKRNTNNYLCSEKQFIYDISLLADHKPLTSIFGSKKGITVYAANSLQRWDKLLVYNTL